MGLLDSIFGKKEKKMENGKNAEDYFTEGAVHIEQQNFQKGIESFKKCIEINPKHSKACMGLCIGYAGTMDLNSARKQYEILKRLDPNLAEQLANTPTGAIILNGEIIKL